MNKLENKPEISTAKTKRTAKLLPDKSCELFLSNGTRVVLRAVDAADFVEASEDENMMLASLVTTWGDRSSVMGSELGSRGFLDIADAVFLRKVLRKLFAPDIKKITKETLVKDLGENGLQATLPSGLKIHLRRPDGYDLEQNDLTQIQAENEAMQGLELAKASIKMAATLALQWGDIKGSLMEPAITYEQLLERGALLSDDVFALIKIISDNFFRVEESIEF